MTTYGHDNLIFAPRRQMLGALEALNGVIVFGLTTAFLFAVLQAALRRSGGEILGRGRRLAWRRSASRRTCKVGNPSSFRSSRQDTAAPARREGSAEVLRQRSARRTYVHPTTGYFSPSFQFVKIPRFDKSTMD
jgi:hypothetical protein